MEGCTEKERAVIECLSLLVLLFYASGAVDKEKLMESGCCSSHAWLLLLRAEPGEEKQACRLHKQRAHLFTFLDQKEGATTHNSRNQP